MRILHVIDSLDPKHGGPSVCVPSIASAQVSLGHEVEIVFLADKGAENIVYRGLELIPNTQNIKITSIKNSRLLNLKQVAVLKNTIASCDVVHMHGLWGKLVLSASLLARRSATPYVFTPHGMLDPWSLSQKKRLKKILMYMGVRSLLGACSFLHALNSSEAELIRPLGLKCPVKIFPNGIFPNDFVDLPEKGTFYNKFPELCGRPYILFLSRLHYKKGLDYVADAFAQIADVVRDVDIVVAGPDSGAKNDFLEKIKLSGLTSRVHVVGPLYGIIKYAAFRDAACFLLPSRQEGFSIAITEALACGVPVVISENCNFSEVEEVGAGFVVRLQIKEIRKALIRILQDKGLAKEMSNRGKSLILENFTWEKIASQIVIAYSASTKGEDSVI